MTPSRILLTVPPLFFGVETEISEADVVKLGQMRQIYIHG